MSESPSSMNPKTIMAVIGALLVVGVGSYFYQQSAEKKEQEDKSAFYQVQKTFEEETNALPEAERPSGIPLDVAVKFPKTVAALNQMLTEKKVSKRILFEASMKLGALYLDRGQSQQAVQALKSMPELGQSAFQKASGYFLLASAQEKAGLFQEAAESYQNGLAKDVEGLKPEFMLGVIRTMKQTQQVDKAKTFLERLKKEFPGTKALETAEKLLSST